MKLVTYTHGAIARPGLLVTAPGVKTDDASGAVVLDLIRSLAWVDGRKNAAAKDERAFAEKFGDSVLGFIEHAVDARPLAADAIAAHGRGELPAKTDAGAIAMPAADVTLLSPIPRPPSMRDGYAFRQHVETARKNRGLEMIPEFDQFPVFYFTNHQAVIGPGPLRVRPRHLERLDYELEAAIVVGREARDLTAANADEVIFGMTIMNDFSARALQMQEMLLSLGPAKGKDFATGLGPYLVTMDELAERTVKTPRGNTFDLGMRAFVNGEKLSQGNVNDMTWTFAQILERASYGVTLYPGDVIGSGTCGTGCFLELNGSKITKDQWLKPGDVVALEIDRLGRLENTVVAD
ncbi:MAG: Catechol pathway protein [Labilithrix sp.]|nr:Catechol pathway protein [Labilithrix sp.]